MQRLLLDTHALLWAFYQPELLPEAARAAIASPDSAVHISAVSAYEIGLKVNLGKLEFAASLTRNFRQEIESQGFSFLDLTWMHSLQAGFLPLIHKDPFDRMLIAQAQIEQLTLISNEKLFDQFGIIRLW